jgi:hypothetical protein
MPVRRYIQSQQANKIAVTSGGAGDIIFSYPVMRALGVRTLYVKESFYPPGYGSLYGAIKEITEYNGFECLPTPDEGLGFDQFHASCRYHINMDAWRSCRMRGVWHIMKSMANYWQLRGISPTVPWLRLDAQKTDLTGSDYTLWVLTPRWRQSACNWYEVWRSVQGQKFFMGWPTDYEEFSTIVQDTVTLLPTADFMEMARYIRDCRALYCNQSTALAIACGLGIHHYCAYKGNKTNCRTRTQWDHPI